MAGLKNLITYQQSKEILDLTVEFCPRFLPGREMLRQRDQMIQAARSGKQNIVEGYSLNSLKGYLKLLGISRGSLEELLEDFLDLARRWSVKLWEKDDPQLEELRKVSRGSKGSRGKYELPLNPSDPSDPSYPVNYMVYLINRTCYLLHRQIKALEKKFIEEGGYTEKLFRERLDYRRKTQQSTFSRGNIS